MVESWVYLNGHFILEKLATIPLTDRGFLFGDGIFTTIRIHQGKCEFLSRHLHRLQQQAEFLNFHLPSFSLDWIEKFIQLNEAKEGTWRLKVIITVKQEGVNRIADQVLATLHPYLGHSSAPSTLCLFPFLIETPLAHVKSLSYLDHLYVKQYAQRQGFEDAITRNSEGFLLETSSSNLFWIDQGKCWVPDPELPYLKGIFLQALIEYLTLPVQFVKMTMDQLSASASVYTSNVLTHVRPVLSIEHRTFNRSPEWESVIQRAISEALKDHSL